MPRRQLLDRGDVIFESVGVQVAVRYLRELLGATGRAAPVQRDNYKPELGVRRLIQARTLRVALIEVVRRDRDERTRVLRIEHRISARRIEVTRLVDDAIDIGLAISGLGDKLLRRAPP